MRTALIRAATAIGALALAPLVDRAAAQEVDEASRERVAAGNQRFALDLYRRLSTQEGNLAFSPHSLSTALAMTLAGARGRTAEEMAAVLHLDRADPALHATFAELARRLQARGDDQPARVELSLANRLWPDVRETVRPAFVELLGAHYAGGLEPLDFRDAPAAALRINAWCADATRQRIPELVTSDDVAGAALVLTNAIAFRGDWSVPFDPERTLRAAFHVTPERTVEVAMMQRTGQHAFARTEQYRALQLDFAGERFALLCLLPEAPDGLPALERSLTPGELARCVAALRDASVSVRLPRFALRSRFELAEVLSALGMPTAFSARADFTGMVPEPGVFLSSVIHEAFVAVDETGAEAAAATAVIAKRGGRPEAFHADRPFLFLLRERATGSVLFLGRVTEPEA